MQLSQILEIAMMIAFGFSWPNNILTTLKNKSTKGKSLAFLCLIFFGYIAGIVSKLTAESFQWYVLFFYVLNLVMVGVDLCLYYRNYRLDQKGCRSASSGKAHHEGA